MGTETTAIDIQKIGRESYAAGFGYAIGAAIAAIRSCGSLDENGYICEKSAAIKAVKELAHGE